LFATTRRFLDDLGLASLDALPPLDGHAVPQQVIDGWALDEPRLALPDPELS